MLEETSNTPAPRGAGRTKNRSLPPGLTRREHTKSRNGCMPCKARRIKCDETRPECNNCQAKSNLRCRYTDPPPREKRVVRAVLNPVDSISSPFTWQDLRALHHFLVYCPPALPLGNAEIWTKSIPALAHEQGPLMQAILALGSSHAARIMRCSHSEIQALQHRGQALVGLKDLMDKSEAWTRAEVDGVLAICYALMFQSCHIPNSMQEYMTLVKGCALITEHIRRANISTTFDVSTHRVQSKLEAQIAPILENCSYRDLIDEASEAMDALLLDIVDPLEAESAFAVREILRSFDHGLVLGISVDMEVYSLWYRLSEAWVKVFSKPNRSMGKIVFAYFLGIQLVIHYLFPLRWWPKLVAASQPSQLVAELVQWIQATESSMSDNDHFEWPRKVIARLPTDLTTTHFPLIVFDLPSKVHFLQTMHFNAHMILGDITRICASLTAWFESILQLKALSEGIPSTRPTANHSDSLHMVDETQSPPHESRMREMQKRIGVFEHVTDPDEGFPSPAVAENFLQLKWS